MRNIFKTILFMVVFALSFLLFPLILDKISTGTYEITNEKIRMAITIGVVVPLVLILSRKIKNDYVYLGVATVFMFVAIFLLKLLLSQIL